MKYGSAEAAVGDKIVFSSFGSKEAPFNEMTVKAVIEDFDNSIFMSGGIVVHYTAGLRISSPIYRQQVFVKNKEDFYNKLYEVMYEQGKEKRISNFYGLCDCCCNSNCSNNIFYVL